MGHSVVCCDILFLVQVLEVSYSSLLLEQTGYNTKTIQILTMALEKKEQERRQLSGSKVEHKDVQKRYQQDFSRYQRQIEKTRVVLARGKVA